MTMKSLPKEQQSKSKSKKAHLKRLITNSVKKSAVSSCNSRGEFISNAKNAGNESSLRADSQNSVQSDQPVQTAKKAGISYKSTSHEKSSRNESTNESKSNKTCSSEQSSEKPDILKIISVLKKTYPEATCALVHENPLQLLISTILAAQCTDKRVNIVTRELYKKYKTASDFANADFDTLAQEIRSTGFYQNKAKNIIACCRQLVEKHGGRVPADLNALIALPGVGRKTANVVLGTAFRIASGIVVDTHVARLSKRLGLSNETSPEKIEQDLMQIVPREDWIDFSHLLIAHGRNRCQARSPDCNGCELAQLCPKIIE